MKLNLKDNFPRLIQCEEKTFSSECITEEMRNKRLVQFCGFLDYLHQKENHHFVMYHKERT